MCVVHLCSIWLEWRIDSTAFVTSTPTICQNFWKKKGDIPSGLGDFEGHI